MRDAAKDMFVPLRSTIRALSNTPITPEKIDLGKALFDAWLHGDGSATSADQLASLELSMDKGRRVARGCLF